MLHVGTDQAIGLSALPPVVRAIEAHIRKGCLLIQRELVVPLVLPLGRAEPGRSKESAGVVCVTLERGLSRRACAPLSFGPMQGELGTGQKRDHDNEARQGRVSRCRRNFLKIPMRVPPKDSV